MTPRSGAILTPFGSLSIVKMKLVPVERPFLVLLLLLLLLSLSFQTIHSFTRLPKTCLSVTSSTSSLKLFEDFQYFGESGPRVDTPTFVAPNDQRTKQNHWSSPVETTSSTTEPAAATTDTHLILPGGGIMLFWQLGMISYLDEHFDLSRVTMTGASAGAVAAACAATRVDWYDFVDRILDKCADMDIWNRPLGLFGVLGEITEDALQTMLPPDTAELLSQRRVSVLLMSAMMSDGWSMKRVDGFDSRQNAIDAILTSAHIPWFANGEFLTLYEGEPYIDGSLFATERDYLCRTGDDSYANHDPDDVTRILETTPVIWVHHLQDPVMANVTLLDCVSVPPREGVWDLFHRGRLHAQQADANGQLSVLQRKDDPSRD